MTENDLIDQAIKNTFEDSLESRTVTIVFGSSKLAHEFMTYMDCQGEQWWWDWCNNREVKGAEHVEYDYRRNSISITAMKETEE